MNCALTQDFNLDCIDSHGGVKSIYFMEYENLTAKTVTAGVVTAMTFATGKNFRKYNLVKYTAMADETKTVNEETGTSTVAQNIKIYCNKLQASVRNELTLLAQNRLLAVVIDNNGKGWLYGADNALIATTVKGATGTKGGDRNGYELDFKGEELNLALEVNSATIEDLQTAGS